ncbi:MAG: hypothetical protein WCF67_11885 [Chitinophagaceae bacterium]
MSVTYLSSISPSDPKDVAVAQFVDAVTDQIKINVLQAMAATSDPTNFKFKPGNLKVGVRQSKEYPSAALVVQKYVHEMPEEKKRVVLSRQHSSRFFTAPLRTQVANMGIDMASEKYALTQADLKGRFRFFNEATAKKVIDRVTELTEQNSHESPNGAGVAGVAGAGPAPTISVNRGLKFKVHQVKCIDETGNWLVERAGSDTINMGGVTLDDTDRSEKINQFRVGSFNDGTTKNYSPAQLLKSFTINGGGYPKTYAVFLSLAEKDSGGFGSFIQELYDAIRAEVTTILTALGAAAGAAIGGAIGGSIGTAVAGPIGTIIGVAAGLILGAVIGWIVGLLSDDIFTPQVATITLTSSNGTFVNNSLQSPQMNLRYRQFSGEYNVKYSWEIVR